MSSISLPAPRLIRLYTLGASHILANNGRTVARMPTQPRPLALLSYLTAAYPNPGAFHRRDNLLALFWPDHDEKHARWALNQAVHRLRSQLGSSIIVNRGADAIAVSPDVLWCDAVAFLEACARDDWSAALELYRGEFLDGLHVAGCAELSEWMDSQRARIRRVAAHANWSLVDRLEAQGALQEAIECARNGVSLAPEYEPGVRRLIALLDQSGDRAGAMYVYEGYVNWLSDNLEVEPAPETAAAINAVKSRARAIQAAGSLEAGTAAGLVAGVSAQARSESDIRAQRSGQSWVTFAAATCGTIVLIAMAALWRHEVQPRPSESIRSIAVLPLTNRMQDPEQDYFVDGMHEALISELSKIGALKVMSQSSMLRYRQTDKPLPQLARELNVDGVIEGSVLREGEHVQIKVQLFHGPADRHLWVRSFERELGDFRALQSDVARAIAEEIRVGLTPQEQRVLSLTPSIHSEAYQAYLRGRHHLGKGTLGAFENARVYFNQALDLDPTHAPTYVGLADVYSRLAILGHEPPRSVYPLAKAAIARALQLDETLAEAHALQGVVKFRFDWDWEGAERSLTRALELEPNGDRAHLGYGMYLLAIGRLEGALAHSAKFQELHPLSRFASQNLAWHLYHNQRYDEAILRLHDALVLDPRSGLAYALLGENYVAEGKYSEAISACDTAVGLTLDDDRILSTCGAVYAASGRHRDAMGLYEELQQRLSAHRYVDPYHLASLAAAIYTSPTDGDRVLQWLIRAYEERSANLCVVKVNRAFNVVSADPRFQELLRRMDFPK